MLNLYPLLMFVLLIVLLTLEVPVAFALAFIGLVFARLLWGPESMALLIHGVWSVMNNYNFIAIPLFVFMATLLERTGFIEDLYDCIYKWLGTLRGGLAITTIVVGAIIAAMSGVVAAGIVTLGLIALPQMFRHNYNKKISLGSVLAGGTLGQLIPPSQTMIVYGAMTGVSVGKLFAGGLSTGLVLVMLYSLYVLIRSFLNKDLCPAVKDTILLKEKLSSLRMIIVPLLIVISVLGSIFSGAATPVEGAGIGVCGVLFFGLIMRRLKLPQVTSSGFDTLKVTAMVGWIIIGALTFGYVFSGIGGKQLVMDIAMAMPFGRWGAYLVFTLFILFLGMFLDNSAIIVIAAPIVSPVMVNLGFDPLWWGLVFMVLSQIAYLSPPFGYSLFYLKGVSPKDVTLQDIYLAALPFLGLQIIGVLLLTLIPKIGTWLPNLLMSR